MRLMVGESGHIPDHFRHLRQTKSWFEGSRAFCTDIYDVLPSEVLSDDQPLAETVRSTTRTHAYLVAQMMGHSHPAVTLQYYIHGMDWLLDTCLRVRRNPQPSTLSVALASGSPVRTAYNWVDREQDTAAIPERVLSRKWPVLKTATPAVAEQVPLWPWRASDLLYRHLTRGEELAAIAGDYDFSPEQAAGMLRRVSYLFDTHARLGRKGWQHGMEKRLIEQGIGVKKRIACPIIPQLPTDIKVVTTLAPELSRLLESKSKPHYIPVLRYYVDNIWQRWNQLFFRDPDKPGEAIAYRKLLKKIVVDNSQHRFFVFHDPLQYCKETEQWKAALGLPQEVSPIPLRPPNTDRGSYDSWIGIEPILSDSKNVPNNCTGSYGLRFLMLMGYVVYGE